MPIGSGRTFAAEIAHARLLAHWVGPIQRDDIAVCLSCQRLMLIHFGWHVHVRVCELWAMTDICISVKHYSVRVYKKRFFWIYRQNEPATPILPAGTRKPGGIRVPVFVSSDPARQTGRTGLGICLAGTRVIETRVLPLYVLHLLLIHFFAERPER